MKRSYSASSKAGEAFWSKDVVLSPCSEDGESSVTSPPRPARKWSATSDALSELAARTAESADARGAAAMDVRNRRRRAAAIMDMAGTHVLCFGIGGGSW